VKYLLALLLLACAPARAEWVKIGQVEKSSLLFLSSKTVYYIDPSSVTREGNVRKVWQIRDLADKGSRGERSVLEAVEYDCLDKQMRTVSASGHSRTMGQGEIIPLSGVSVTDEWIPLRAGKEYEIFYKILNRICAP